jgi:hypothetical protein
MTTITVTPRLREFINRCFTVDYRKLKVRMNSALKHKRWDIINNHLEYNTKYNENINITIRITPPIHDGDCKYFDDDDDTTYYDFDTARDPCDCKHDTHTIRIEIRYKLTEFYFKNIESDNIHNLSNIINEIPTTFQICVCFNVADVNGDCIDKCDVCFKNSYIRTEVEGGDCAICLNNDSHCWNGLPCSHNFHTHCLWKLSDKKCPLCREPYNDEKRNVYNV